VLSRTLTRTNVPRAPARPAAHTGARRLSYGNLQRDASAAAKWKVRHNILEAVNELIDELHGIQQQARGCTCASVTCACACERYERAREC
jgi:hypothetical protein